MDKFELTPEQLEQVSIMLKGFHYERGDTYSANATRCAKLIVSKVLSLLEPEQTRQDTLREVGELFETQCLNPKHQNYKYGKTDCHECIDKLVVQLKRGELPKESE